MVMPGFIIKKVLAIAEKANDLEMQVVQHVKFGNLALLENNAELAQEQFGIADSLVIQSGIKTEHHESLIGLARVKLKSKMFKEAEELLLRAENSALKEGNKKDLARFVPRI